MNRLATLLVSLALLGPPAMAEEPIILHMPHRGKDLLRAAWEKHFDLTYWYGQYLAVMNGRVIRVGAYTTGDHEAETGGFSIGLTGSGADWEIPGTTLTALPLWSYQPPPDLWNWWQNQVARWRKQPAIPMPPVVMWGARPLDARQITNWIGQLYHEYPDHIRRATLDCEPPLVQPVLVEVE